MIDLTSWLRPTTLVHAHCDIPCGIYDPSEAVLAARTVARMVELIGKLPEGVTAVADRNTFLRCVAVDTLIATVFSAARTDRRIG